MASQRTAPGRPRGFDPEVALDRAVEVFWRHGYEGASMTDLTEAMGINKPSLYAAYGNKQRLFELALARYAETDLAYAKAALEQPTGRAVIEWFLRQNVKAVTAPGRPVGCFSVQTGLACSPDNAEISQTLVRARRGGELALRDRLKRARQEGDLPADVDPGDLARYVMTVSEGIAVHAAAGVTRRELNRTVDLAIRVLDGMVTAVPAVPTTPAVPTGPRRQRQPP
jgi:AcrR family transcriptional regulator